MSRWVEGFENHDFQAVWKEILEVTEAVIPDDKTVVTSVEEIARFKKIIIFLNELLDSCDPELVPESTWNNFNSQAVACLQQINAYQSNRSIGYIKKANAHLDNLLTYIRPYQVVAGKAAKSASASFSAYTRAINSNLSSFQEEAKALISEIGDLKDIATNNADESDVASTRVKELEVKYFDDNDSESLRTRIQNFEREIEESYEKITKLRAKIFDGDSGEEPIESEIRRTLVAAESNGESVRKLLGEVKTKLSDFKIYYGDVFGEKNEDGELKGGLKNEMLEREKHLDNFKEKQELRYEALNSEIEGLLPGATSAGMATAYHDLKESFEKPIKNYSTLFYGSIGCLTLVAFLSIIQEISWSSIKFVEV